MIIARPRSSGALECLYGYWAYGHPFAARVQVPSDRPRALRKALKSTIEDSAFLAEPGKAGLEADYMSPEEIERRVRIIENTLKSVVDKIRMMAPSENEARPETRVLYAQPPFRRLRESEENE